MDVTAFAQRESAASAPVGRPLRQAERAPAAVDSALCQLIQTSDFVAADRGARVHEDAAASLVDHDRVAAYPNACEVSSHPSPQ
jgi:hypothetical protein